MQTYQGIDRCGDRLAAEIVALVQQHPQLQYISLVGHSMGGLLVRYAAGKLYKAETGLVAGLRPMHFITIASPHLGCDVVGEPQVWHRLACTLTCSLFKEVQCMMVAIVAHCSVQKGFVSSRGLAVSACERRQHAPISS